MSQSLEWETWRRERMSGKKTTEEWLQWAELYIASLPDGEWKKHCTNHFRFVKRDAENNR